MRGEGAPESFDAGTAGTINSIHWCVISAGNHCVMMKELL